MICLNISLVWFVMSEGMQTLSESHTHQVEAHHDSRIGVPRCAVFTAYWHNLEAKGEHNDELPLGLSKAQSGTVKGE